LSRRLYIAGHRGLLGRALERVLAAKGDVELVHDEDAAVDLRDPAAAARALERAAPDTVVLAAARVGGLGANLADPVGFLEDNLRIQLNVVRSALDVGVRRLLFVASANAYPADAPQPIREASLGAGAIDPATEAYGLAKLTGVRLCAAYRRQHGVLFHSVIPCNVYGPGDRFEAERAHLVAATLRRYAEAVRAGAPEVTVWGSGEQRRQLLYVDDLARACARLLELADPPEHVNIAPIGDTSVRELALAAAQTVGFSGRTLFDPARPEGVRRRELDPSVMRGFGWSPQVGLSEGLQATWDWYRASTAASTHVPS
jgi:GDP-L-fucose synthase